jgi:catalase
MNRLAFLPVLFISVTACASQPDAPEDEGPTYEEDAKADSGFEDGLEGTRNEWGEVIRPDEQAVFAKLAQKINELQRIQSVGGIAQRGFHAKTHACMKAEFRPAANRPAETRHGVFASDDVRAAWVRISNGQGRSLRDNERDVRGLAIKLMDVQGERLLGDDATTQDFLMTNRPASHVNDAIEFMDFADAAANGKLGWWAIKHPVSAARLFRQTAPVTTLVTTYWSGSAYRVGPKPAKLSVRPCAGQPATTQGTTSADPNYLRLDLEHRLASGDVCYELAVQLRRDPTSESVEKGSSVWDEQKNPFIPVGQLVIARRSTAEARVDEEYCNDLAFNPWNGVVEHQPLGHMNRARRPVYQSSAQFRGHVPEPKPELDKPE